MIKLEFSLLSKNRSVVGIDITKNGMINKGYNDTPVFQSTIDITFGFLFGYVTLQFNNGNAIEMEDLFKQIKEHSENIVTTKSNEYCMEHNKKLDSDGQCSMCLEKRNN